MQTKPPIITILITGHRDESEEESVREEDAQDPDQYSEEDEEETFFQQPERPHKKKPKQKHRSSRSSSTERAPLRNLDHQENRRSGSNMSGNGRCAVRTTGATTNGGQDAAALQQELVQTQQALRAALSSKKKTSKKGKPEKNGYESAMETEIKKAVVAHLWPHCKFITTEQRLTVITGKLFDEMDLKEKEGLSETDLELKKTVWVSTWEDTVRSAFNGHRNYVQEQVMGVFKKAIMEEKYDPDYPAPKDMVLLACRSKMTQEESADWEYYRGLFVKYWNELLPCVSGNQRWGPGKRCYQTICAARMDPSDSKSMPCVTVSDEAFLVALVENSYDKWVYMFKDLKGDPKAIADAKKNKLPVFDTKYTNPRAGQSKFGGWKPEGRNRVKTLKKKIMEAREREHVAKLEDEILKMVRSEHDQDEKDQKRAASGRKRKSLVTAVVDKNIPDDIADWD